MIREVIITRDNFSAIIAVIIFHYSLNGLTKSIPPLGDGTPERLLNGKGSMGNATGTLRFGLVLLRLLFLFLVLFLLLLAVLLLFLFPGGLGLCGLQGIFEVLSRLGGLALGIDGYLYLVLDSGFDTPFGKCGLVILREHEIGIFLSGLPCDVTVVGFSLFIYQTGHLDRSATGEFKLRFFGKLLLSEGLGNFLIGGLLLHFPVFVHRQLTPFTEEKFKLHLGCVELDGSFVSSGLLPFFGFGLELTDDGFALLQLCDFVGGEAVPVLFGGDAHLVQRERYQFVRFQVSADKGRDFLACPVGNLGGMPDIAGHLYGGYILVGQVVPEKLLLHLVKVENTVAANDQLAVGVLTQGKLAVVAVGKGAEIEIHPDGLVGLEAF